MTVPASNDRYNHHREVSRMKQLPGDIRNRLARRSSVQNSISRMDIGEAVEAEAASEDGRPGSPDYFSSLLEEEKDEEDNDEQDSPEKGKGIQIDFEA